MVCHASSVTLSAAMNVNGRPCSFLRIMMTLVWIFLPSVLTTSQPSRMDDDHADVDTLETDRLIGFNGGVRGGLLLHPDNTSLVYSVGSNVVIEDLTTGQQTILSSHTDMVTCLAIDPTGKYIASGQVTEKGLKAPIILWDYESKKPILEWKLHEMKVEALAFSVDNSYLISLGGGDGINVMVWDLGKRTALTGALARKNTCLATSLVNPNVFVTGGDTLRVWELDVANRKIRPTDVNLGRLKRVVKYIEIADDNTDYPYMFCGTTTGDILAINMKSPHRLQFFFSKKDIFGFGVTALSLTNYRDNNFDLVVGACDGVVGRYKIKLSLDTPGHVKTTWKRHDSIKLNEGSSCIVTSITKWDSENTFFVGTVNNQVYEFYNATWPPSLVKLYHTSSVNNVMFTFGDSKLLVTCVNQGVWVWNIARGQVLCRATEMNKICNAVSVTRDDKFIFSAWDDGRIRVYALKKERMGRCILSLKSMVKNAHNQGVTAMAITSNGTQLVTGGEEGQVRVWQIIESSVELEAVMKEHKGKVTSIQIHPNDQSCVSVSTDGLAILWDLETKTRNQSLFAHKPLNCVCFGENGEEILTGGTEIQIWNVRGVPQLELERSQTGAISTMDISSDGEHFITGGEDRLLRLWNYRGQVTHVGLGHDSRITTVRISPDRKTIVSGGADGAIYIWKFPTSL